MDEVQEIFSLTTAADFEWIVLDTWNTSAVIIPEYIFGDHRITSTIWVRYMGSGTPILKIHPNAFHSSWELIKEFYVISYDLRILNYQFLAYLNQISSITMKNCKNVHLSSLSHLPNLSNLEIIECSGVNGDWANVPHWGKYSHNSISIENIDLYDGDDAKMCLLSIQSKNGSISLKLYGNDSNPYQFCPKIRRNAFQSFRNISDEVILESLDMSNIKFSFLTGFQKLKDLILWNVVNAHLSAFPQLPSLKELRLYESSGLFDWTNLAQLDKKINLIYIVNIAGLYEGDEGDEMLRSSYNSEDRPYSFKLQGNYSNPFQFSPEIHPDAFRSFQNIPIRVTLKSVDMCNFNFSFLAGFQELNDLVLWNVVNVHLAALPLLPSLNQLSLYENSGLNEWTHFPPSIYRFTGLDLQNNGLTDEGVDRILEWLVNGPSKDTLGFLYLSGNALTRIPQTIKSFSMLYEILLNGQTGSGFGVVPNNSLVFLGPVLVLNLENSSITEIQNDNFKGPIFYIKTKIRIKIIII